MRRGCQNQAHWGVVWTTGFAFDVKGKLTDRPYFFFRWVVVIDIEYVPA